MRVNVLLRRPAIISSMAGRRFLLYVLFTTVVLLPPFGPQAGHAASTVACHCFQERVFSPDNPASFDSYLLATVQNRLLAYTFQRPRKEIVRDKMTGASGDDLWIAHLLAHVTGLPVVNVQALFAQQENRSWRLVVAELGVDPEVLGSPFMAALLNDDSAGLAWAVVAQVFEQRFAVPGGTFLAQRSRATLKEAILATILLEMKGDRIGDPIQRVRDGESWGQVTVADSGVSVDTLDDYLAKSFVPGKK